MKQLIYACVLPSIAGCVASGGVACEFNDAPVSRTAAATNGMTGESVEDAIIGSVSYDAGLQDEPTADDEALQALAPFAIEFSERDENVVMRTYADDSCGEEPGTSAVVVPIDVHIESSDGAAEASGGAYVYGGDPLWFSAHDDAPIAGTLPTWAADAAATAYAIECTSAGLEAAWVVHLTLSGEPTAPELSMDIDATGDCNFTKELAKVQLSRVP